VKGKVVFSAHEAERASNFVVSSKLEERIKAALQQKRFVLHQEADTASTHFCNEYTYGNVNVLWVCGRWNYSYGSKG